jgi:WD40 repeat protein
MLHDVATGQLLPMILRHQGGVKGLQISRDGRLAVTMCPLGNGRHRVSAWDLASGAERSCDVSLPNESLTGLTLHPDQASVILTSTTGNQSRFWQWDLVSPALRPLWEKGVPGTVWSASFSPDGSHLLAMGGSRARLLTAAKGELEKTFSPHGPVTAANFSPSGRFVATSSLDGDVKLWFADPQHPQCGRVALKVSQAHGSEPGRSSVNSVAFSPVEAEDAMSLVTAGSDGTAQLWRFTGGAVHREQPLRGHRGRVRTAVFSPDGRLVLTASDDKTARLWVVATGEPAGPGGGVLSHNEAVLFAAFSPDGSLVITGCDDNNAYVWDLSDLTTGEPRLLQGHTAAVTSTAISPDNRRAITGSQDGIAKLWDLAAGKEILSLKRHAAELTSVHFAPDGSSILTSSLDRTALVWPAEKIGPSLKLSSSRLVIPRTAGTHAIDTAAQILDPDAESLEGGTLRAWLKAGPSSSRVTLEVAARDLEMVQDQIVLVAGGERRPLAVKVPQDEPASALELRFLPGAQLRDAERLLRAINLRQEQSSASPVTVLFQLVDGGGLASNVAEASVQSADAPSQRTEVASAETR